MSSKDNSMQSLWKTQSLEPLQALPPAEMRRLASELQRRINRRNRREYIAGAVVLPVFLAYAWIFPYWLTKLGALLCVAGLAVVMWQLHKRASARDVPEALGASHLAFHRAELERQRDALRDVWLWYIAPLVPGMVVFMWGRQTELKVWLPWIYVICGALLIAIAVVNRFAARRLQRQIDELDAFAGAPSINEEENR